MKKLLTIIVAFSFFIVGCEKEMEIQEVENEVVQLKSAGTGFTAPNVFDAEGKYCDLVNAPGSLAGKYMQIWMGVGTMGAGELVGSVRFDSDNGKVIINLADSDGDGVPDMYPYVASEVHMHFADDPGDIPQTKSGNPKVGKFEHNIDLAPFKTEIVIENVVFQRYGAIHLTVEYRGGVDGFAFYLPDDPVQVSFTYPGSNSYLEMEILSDNAGDLKGAYDNWCVNTEITISPGTVYEALLYSSYESLPAGIVDKPGNFDLINYLINNYAAGDVVQLMNEDCTPVLVDENPVEEAITLWDIQKAIWAIIDDGTFWFLGDPDWSQERVNAIVCEVMANGEGFVPGCDEQIVFVVVPVDPDLGIQLVVAQPTISSVPVPCEDVGETAWGDGYWGATFTGRQWGTWFEYDATCGN